MSPARQPHWRSLRWNDVKTASAESLSSTNHALDSVERLRQSDAPQVLLVDDAEFVTDTGSVFQQLLAARPSNLRVIAAGRSDALRSTYGHWTQEVRRSRCGLLLDPSLMETYFVAAEFVATRPGRFRPWP